MIEPEREELLSAYLDGEVSSEERARVEQWLAESGELRQLRDELLTLRADLQSLPRHELGQELAAAVLHRSTASAIPEESKPSAAALDSRAETSLGKVVTEWWHRGSPGRRFLWPVLAVAAALAILVFDARQRPAEFEVAQAPEGAPAEAELTSEPPAAPSVQPAPASEPAMSAPEAASPSADSTARRTAGNPPADRSAELQTPATPRRQVDFFDSSREPMGATGATGKLAPPRAPAGDAKLGRVQPGERAESGTLEVETIVYPVTPQYLEGRQFEKLLEANRVRWHQVPVPRQLQEQGGLLAPRTAPLESLGKSPLQSLYYLDAGSEQVNEILSQVPQAERLLEGKRVIRPQQATAAKVEAAAGVQVLLVAPTDATVPAAPAKPSR